MSDCHADDIDADVIFFFDPHSHHHIKIEGIEKHPALKLEYWNDIHQKTLHGILQSTGQHIYKIGRKDRYDRFVARNCDHVVSPVKGMFYEFFERHFRERTDNVLWHFPHALKYHHFGEIPLEARRHAILANGATYSSFRRGYALRKWAFTQKTVTFVPHVIFNGETPKGSRYAEFISKWAGALAMCEYYAVPKYLEMPLAGCLTFMEHTQDAVDIGFKDFETCVYVNQENFLERTQDFLNHMEEYRSIAEAGRNLVANNYPADHFADFIYEKCKHELELRGSPKE